MSELQKLELSDEFDNRGFYYRDSSLADRGVIEQIFDYREYKIDFCEQGERLLQFYKSTVADKTPIIIDAGANIGATPVFFATKFRRSQIFAVEPSLDNCELLRKNSTGLDITIFEGAIGNEDGSMFIQDPGRGEWGYMVDTTGTTPTPVISPNTILSKFNDNYFPFIFKIDIEGGEKYLFSKNTEWVSKFPLLVVELHDWMLPFQGTSKNFLKTISDNNFDIVHRGENVFCFNGAFLN